TTANGDLDIKLYNSSGNQIDISQGTSDNERISLNGRPAGDYYLKVYGYNGATNDYSFVLNGPPTSGSGDFLESNDTQATAFHIPTIASDSDPGFTMSGMSINPTGDVDWYKFDLLDTGGSSHCVQIDFTSSNGDLDMKLFDAGGNQVDVSQGTSDTERISLS